MREEDARRAGTSAVSGRPEDRPGARPGAAGPPLARRAPARRIDAEEPVSVQEAALHSRAEHTGPEPAPSAWQRSKYWVFRSPIRCITIGFACAILIGTALLMLPLASQAGIWTSPLVALFTATSASCVTGLVLVDTASYWSHFGQAVILALIQVGGLGIVTISSIFMMAAGKRIRFKTMLAMQESIGSESFVDVRPLVLRILKFTLAMEGLGAAVLTWRYALYMPFLSALRRGLFQSVSAFCNAGFDLMGDIRGPFSSLNSWNGEPLVLLTTAVLIVTGGLGFVLWSDILSFPRQRRLSFHSKLVLGMTLLLIVGGGLCFAALEWQNGGSAALGRLPFPQKIVAALFQSVTLRTAGFTSIDQGQLFPASKFLAVFFMLVGAGPASTGGGLKVTSAALIGAGVLSYLRGEKGGLRLGRHKIAQELFVKAAIILCLGLGIVAAASLLLLLFEGAGLARGDFGVLDLIYEATSAFATVGNTSVPTLKLSALSWAILIPCMYLGRVGPASFAMSFAFRPPKAVETVLPEGRTFVG